MRRDSSLARKTTSGAISSGVGIGSRCSCSIVVREASSSSQTFCGSRRDEARRDRVDADAVGREARGERARERRDAALGRGVGVEAGAADERVDRAREDDRARLLLQHLAAGVLDDAEDAGQAEVDHARPDRPRRARSGGGPACSRTARRRRSGRRRRAGRSARPSNATMRSTLAVSQTSTATATPPQLSATTSRARRGRCRRRRRSRPRSPSRPRPARPMPEPPPTTSATTPSSRPLTPDPPVRAAPAARAGTGPRCGSGRRPRRPRPASTSTPSPGPSMRPQCAPVAIGISSVSTSCTIICAVCWCPSTVFGSVSSTCWQAAAVMPSSPWVCLQILRPSSSATCASRENAVSEPTHEGEKQKTSASRAQMRAYASASDHRPSFEQTAIGERRRSSPSWPSGVSRTGCSTKSMSYSASRSSMRRACGTDQLELTSMRSLGPVAERVAERRDHAQVLAVVEPELEVEDVVAGRELLRDLRAQARRRRRARGRRST